MDSLSLKLKRKGPQFCEFYLPYFHSEVQRSPTGFGWGEEKAVSLIYLRTICTSSQCLQEIIIHEPTGVLSGPYQHREREIPNSSGLRCTNTREICYFPCEELFKRSCKCKRIYDRIVVFQRCPHPNP